MRFLRDNDSDDPILSVVNLIDVFLVVIAMLLMVIAQNPLNPFSKKDVVVVENAGKSDMRITIKQGRELQRYDVGNEIGEGKGTRAGITYKLPDGRLIYVPE